MFNCFKMYLDAKAEKVRIDANGDAAEAVIECEHEWIRIPSIYTDNRIGKLRPSWVAADGSVFPTKNIPGMITVSRVPVRGVSFPQMALMDSVCKKCDKVDRELSDKVYGIEKELIENQYRDKIRAIEKESDKKVAALIIKYKSRVGLR